MTPKLSGPMLAPRAGGPPRSAVVLLHGYGSDGTDLIALGQAWAPSFPQTLFVAPNGPERCAGAPFGFQWFALDFDNPARMQASGMAVVPTVRQFLAQLWAQTGLTAGQTVLAGFSQGAMVALHVGLGVSEPLAGIIAFAGALVAPEPLPVHRAPVLLVHGAYDDVVPASHSTAAHGALRDLGYDVGHHVSPGIGHSISPDGLDAATTFLRRVLPYETR